MIHKYLLIHIGVNIDFYLQESFKTKSFEDLNDSREVALEEPIHPEIAGQDNPAPQNIPDNHFIVEEPEIESRNPCSLCIILWKTKVKLLNQIVWNPEWFSRSSAWKLHIQEIPSEDIPAP